MWLLRQVNFLEGNCSCRLCAKQQCSWFSNQLDRGTSILNISEGVDNGNSWDGGGGGGSSRCNR